MRVDPELKKLVALERRKIARRIGAEPLDIPFALVTKIVARKLMGKRSKIRVINGKRRRYIVE